MRGGIEDAMKQHGCQPEDPPMAEAGSHGEPWELLTDHTETVCDSYPIVGTHGCPIMYVEDFVDLADARHAIACVNTIHAAGITRLEGLPALIGAVAKQHQAFIAFRKYDPTEVHWWDKLEAAQLEVDTALAALTPKRERPSDARGND